MSKSLAGKIALVTGASRGIGRSIAELLSADGALVAVHYGKNKAAADEVVAKIKSQGGDAFAVHADLSKKGATQALFAAFDQELTTRTGDTKFDILVNNAGIAPFVSFRRYDGSRSRRNLHRQRQVAVPHHAGGGEALEGGWPHHLDVDRRRPHAVPAVAAYSMLKAPLDNLTKSLAVELGPRAITVNAVAPGVIDTDMAEFVRYG